VISVSGNSITPFAPICLQKLVEILVRVAQNSTNPTFAHYVFESLGSLVKNTCAQNPSAITQFEAVLFPVFQSILEKDINGKYLNAKKKLKKLKKLKKN
jgi:exportin-2 (importin alpha re-exporter)